MVAVSDAIDVEAIGVVVRIRFADDVEQSTRALVRDAWAGATVVGAMPVAEVSVAHADDVETQLERLSVDVTLRALDRQQAQLIMFHAAGVADARGRVVAFVGPSGRGKTTLSRALGQHYGYVSDETIGVGDDLVVYPYRKPLSVVREGQPKAQLGPASAGLSSLPKVPLKLASLVLLDRRPEAVGPSVETVRLTEALVELVPQMSYLAELGRPLQRLAVLADAVGGVRRITYSESETLVPIVADLMESEPSTPTWAPVLDIVGEVGAYEFRAVDDAIEIDGAIVAITNRDVRVLGGIAPAIWEAVRRGASRADIVAHVVDVYGVPPVGRAEQLVDAALGELLTAGLLVSASPEG